MEISCYALSNTLKGFSSNKHHNNCGCGPLSLLIERLLWMSIWMGSQIARVTSLKDCFSWVFSKCFCLCLFDGHFMCPHHSDQMSQKSRVFRVALWGCSLNIFVCVYSLHEEKKGKIVNLNAISLDDIRFVYRYFSEKCLERIFFNQIQLVLSSFKLFNSCHTWSMIAMKAVDDTALVIIFEFSHLWLQSNALHISIAFNHFPS